MLLGFSHRGCRGGAPDTRFSRIRLPVDPTHNIICASASPICCQCYADRPAFGSELRVRGDFIK